MGRRFVKVYLTHPEVGDHYPEYDGKPVEVLGSGGGNRMAVRRPGEIGVSEFNICGTDNGREWYRTIKEVSIARAWVEYKGKL